ncbi:MAG TPA: transporter [Vicinamibacterales bacterium]
MRGAVAACLIALAGADVAAQSAEPIDADRPGLADSAAIVGRGTWQIETGLQWELHQGEDDTFFPTLFRVGLNRRLEVRVEGNTLCSALVSGHRETGLSPISFGAKLGLVLADDGRPGVGVIGRVFPPWGTNGFDARHLAGDVRLAVDWDMTGHWSLNPNAGFSWSDSQVGSFATGIFAVTLGYSPRPAVSVFVDSAVQQREIAGGMASSIVDGGVAYIPRQNWQFDVSAGARARGETAARMFVAVGVAYRHK